jgi:hypothetical protein
LSLSHFISTLHDEGSVTVDSAVVPFEEDDIHQTAALLQQFHSKDSMELPGSAPAFDAAAAVWAAGYLYRAVQLVMLRNLGEDAVRQLLTPYPGEQSAAAMYSADLCLRYLRDVLELAKGLAPGDALVVQLKNEAARWPLSSVGMAVEGEMDINVIMDHTSLKYSYIDRIIETRDLARCNNKEVKELVEEALGNYAADLWPGYK